MLTTVPRSFFMHTAPESSAAAGRMHLLVVDEDAAVRSACCEIATSLGYVSAGVPSLNTARELMRGNAIDILLLDLRAPVAAGLELLEEVKALHPSTAVIVMTAFATVNSAVEAMRTGAMDYLTKPFAIDEISSVLERAGTAQCGRLLAKTAREAAQPAGAGKHDRPQSGDGEALPHSLEGGAELAPGADPGRERHGQGTGSTFHPYNGAHASKPFIPVDCGSLVPTLIESELFGYVKGAFTGATRAKDGLLASAEGGTVFLDEIGELPLELQAKLLRALQEKEIRPVGAITDSSQSCACWRRPIATWRAMVEQGSFRKDLYFRLNVVNLRIPPLRDRQGRISRCWRHISGPDVAGEFDLLHFSDEALRTMMEYDWPGNVRELENAIERACALSSGPILHMGDLPTQLQDFRMHARRSPNQ